MKKKIFALSMAALLLAMVAVGGTIAYFTAEDSAVNTMTLGSVSIEQLEYERVVEDGAWVAGTTQDKYGYYPDLLQEFTQDKPLFPAYYADGSIKYDDRVSGHQQSWGQVGAPGSMMMFDDSVKGAVDKIVFVKNTGKSDAYVRTLIALECGLDGTSDLVGINVDANHWQFTPAEYIADVQIGYSYYTVIEAIYVGPGSNPNGILAP
ncbi:MAG: hypothetical protein IJC61_02865, partial [Oscillospiraceae bacterium]|nr:hypothetical protein [Oscillospiraceae bacterium]